MPNMKLLPIATLLLLTNCGGTDTQINVLTQYGHMKIEPVQGRPFEYIVRVSNVKDIGYDLDVLETRNDLALRAIRFQCPNARLVGEEVIEKGTALLGQPFRDYLIQIKCAG